MTIQKKSKKELIEEMQELKQKIADLTARSENVVAENKQEDFLLQQTRENYESFFNTIEDFLFVLDEQGNILHTNNTVIDRLGYTQEELSGLSVLMVHPPERREEAGRIVSEMLSGVTEFCPVPLVTKSGIQIPVETRVSHGFWDGKPVIFGVTKDISNVKLSDEKFSKVFYLNPSACGLSDLLTGEYVEVNDKFYTLFGFAKNEVIGKTASELGILTREAINAILLKADSNGNVTNVKTELKAKNGDIKQVLLSAENIYVQDKKYRYTIANDITEIKQAEGLLRESEERYKLITQNTLDVVFMLDKTGKQLFFNESLETMLGYKQEEIIGKSFARFVPISEMPRYLLQLKNVFLKQEINNFITKIYHNNGGLIDVEINGKLVKHNKKLVALGTIRDISERRKAEIILKEKSEELEKINAEKDKFFSIIAHDLKSPFNSIMGFSEILMDQIKEKNYDGIEKYAKIILQSSERAVELLSNLMEWARSQTGRMEFDPEFIEMVSLINEITPLFDDIAGQKSVSISSKLPPNAPVFADKAMINTVMRNLISNAIKFSHPGGEIKIKVNENQKDTIVSVSDKGVGIPKDRIDEIFRIDENHSTPGTQNEKGTGLGLILCKEFVEKHGGEIWVKSKVENLPAGKAGGSTFYFTIPNNPLFTQEVAHGNNGNIGFELLNLNLEILIAEDDETSEMLLEKMVESFNSKIIKAKTGLEAIEACRNNPDTDLILMDIQLPGINGYEATRQIRAFNKEVIIIAQTAYGLSGDREKAIEAGCNDYISKPVKKEKFDALIRGYFKK